MQLGNEVIEMSAIVAKEWRLHAVKTPGTNQWLIFTVRDSLLGMIAMLVILCVALFIVFADIFDSKITVIVLSVSGFLSLFFLVTRLRYIISTVRKYNKNKAKINLEIERQFDAMMKEKYDWYNLSHKHMH